MRYKTAYLKYILLLTLFPIVISAQSQLLMPLNIRAAYDSGTRSLDGKPGQAYWQNRSEYNFDLELDPAQSMLTGKGRIRYYNNSPDTLSQIILRLYPDLYRKGNARDFRISANDVGEGVQFSSLVIDGDSLNTNGADAPRRWGTNMYVTLNNELIPGDQLEIDMAWDFQIPQTSRIRMGNYGDSTFFVAYWYPQVAVYDDIDGWDRFSYGGMQEFYNNFADFDVRITVPTGFCVWATGELRNPEAVLPPEIFARYQSALKSDDFVNIITKSDIENQLLQNNKGNKWHYKADDVPDFAFAVSPVYLWEASSIDNGNGDRVLVSAIYNKNATEFDEVARISRGMVQFFSEDMPGVPFPYPHITVFNQANRGGGMEFPMMVNDGISPSIGRLYDLIGHEIAHTYFPFLMGINERKYAWMDEGWAVFLPSRYVNDSVEGFDALNRRVVGYLRIAGSDLDLPMMIPNTEMRFLAYRNVSYNRAGIAYYFLEDLLGREKFREVLQEYIRRWRGKHPIPYDFFHTFNSESGEDLNWFWRPWFFERKYADLAVNAFKQDGEDVEILIKNIGGLPVPLSMKIFFSDGDSLAVEKSISIWKSGDDIYSYSFNTGKKVVRVQIYPRNGVDKDEDNNVFLLENK